jgi:hypothetical protein
VSLMLKGAWYSSRLGMLVGCDVLIVRFGGHGGGIYVA